MAEGEQSLIRDCFLSQMKNAPEKFDQNEYLFPADHFGSSMMIGDHMAMNELAGFDTSYMSFTQCLQGTIPAGDVKLTPVFHASCSSEFFSPGEIVGRPSPVAANKENSSDSSSTTDVPDGYICHGRKDLARGSDGGKEKSQKGSNPIRKKVEKEKLPRFAFMTRSEVDHLEDGYRWRKYGQKAVKNSSFPRSYYRCTNQKCSVKKRIERCFHNPTIVITTYEGKHTHHSSTSLRQSNGSGFITVPAPSTIAGHRWPAENIPVHALPKVCVHSESIDKCTSNPLPELQQHFLLRDYGLLQDIYHPASHLKKSSLAL